jgi:adenylosuccinate synthase
MATTCVVGILWGDEGKGKVIDFLAADTDFVVRFGGGHNAGHTLVLPTGKLVLHLIPSGIVHPHTVNVIGNGVVVDPIHLCSEIEKIRQRGLPVDLGRNLLLSERAHVIVEAHRRQDQWAEGLRGSGKIGTTGRGIGPAYADRCARIGLRLGDLVRPERLRAALQGLVAQKNAWFGAAGLQPIDVDAMHRDLAAAGETLRPGIVDAGAALRAAHAAGKRILLEGAQGCLLDLEQGTYPFVTSSHASTGGAFSGTGLPPHAMRTVGIAKAYATRVGEGPFPTELKDETGDKLRIAGNEFGSTTGRPRRCGWFDGVLARTTARLNGLSSVALTRLDVLAQFDRIRICTAYELDGQRLTALPPSLAASSRVTPVYEEMPGWKQEISDVRAFGDLPKEARDYVHRIEGLLGVPVDMISVGPERDQAIVTRNIFGGTL